MPLPLLPLSFERLGSTKISSAALTTATVTFAGYDFLWIVCSITGYSGGDIARLRFNGDSAVANYGQRFAYFSGAASAVLSTQAFNGVTNGAVLLGQSGVTQGRIAVVAICNHTFATPKPMVVYSTTASSSGTTELNPVVLKSVAQYTAAVVGPITSCVMLTPSQNMLAGSGFVVYGANML
jgi:hypothetical protein